jgi:ABC-type branched-subunit amino acid transport system substrate-binding protein
VRRTSLLIATAVSAICLAAGLTACGSSGGGGGNKSFHLTIGDSVPLTGDLADYGPPGDKAAHMAVTQIEKAIKADKLKQTLALKTEDNGGGTDPQQAVSAARKLVADGSTCIAGAWASSDTEPTAQSVAIPQNVLLISPASTADEISKLNDNGLVNRTSPPDRYQGPTLANEVAKELGGAKGKVVSVGGRNDSYGDGLTKTFTAAWEKMGGKVTPNSPVLYDPNQATFDSEAQQIVAGNPDAFVIVDFSDTFPKVGPALQRTGKWDPTKAFSTDGNASSDLPKAIDPAIINGMRGTAPGSPENGASADAFNKLWNSTAPKNVGRITFDAQNYDAVTLCYLAAVAAGSTDGKAMADKLIDITAPPGPKYTWQQLPQAIKALQDGKDINYEGASGPIDMNSDGDATAGVYSIYEFKNGTLFDVTSQVPVAQPTS